MFFLKNRLPLSLLLSLDFLLPFPNNNNNNNNKNTQSDRSRWAEARAALEQHSINRHTLRAIADAFYVVALDDASPESQDELAKLALAGTEYYFSFRF